MTFTNQIETNEKNICYYRKAYLPEVFNTLSIDEKRSLIAFTVEEFSNDVSVAYADESFDEIGVLTEQDVLLIYNNIFLRAKKPSSLEVYWFIYKTLAKRFVTRKKNFAPIIQESYINKKWRKKEYRNDTEEIIILRFLLDELLEINQAVWVNDEARKYFSEEMGKVSNRLFQAKEIVEDIDVENSQKQLEIMETNDVHIGRGR